MSDMVPQWGGSLTGPHCYFQHRDEEHGATMQSEEGIPDLFGSACKWQAGGLITITRAALPKAILLPLFQLSSCHLQNIMHFEFFYANFQQYALGRPKENLSWHGPWDAPRPAK